MNQSGNDTKPFINVTPLIDVLLVLLIIFMVVAPTRPHRFKAQIPEPPPQQPDKIIPDPTNLVVSVTKDAQLQLNQSGNFGSINEPAPLIAKLTEVFQKRLAARNFTYEMATRADVPDLERIKRAVFLKAPRSMAYGDVAKVIDSIKAAGAQPVGLQVDALEP